MNKIKLNRTTLIARTSTLTNAIVHSVVPYDSNEKINRVLNERFNDVHVCQYCGLGAKSLDHLFPLVVNKKLSGYISDANNLIPCCKDCNSSKGNTQ
jgi:5-methylcytosine-specific restriction endonuclease McrA